jgi:hypothetical protein
MSNITPDIFNKLLDSRNSILWSSLNQETLILLAYHPGHEYEVQYQEDLVTLLIDRHTPHPAYFTHELLHIKIKRSVLDVAQYYQDQINHYALGFLFSRNLTAHITNCLEHALMLPLFLELGYAATDFTSDHRNRKLSNKDVRQLGQYLKIGSIYRRIAVDAFIGKYFAATSCPNKTHNYEKLLNDMRRFETGLYILLENFWNDWKTLDLTNHKSDFEETIDIHIQDLKNWSINKRFA